VGRALRVATAVALVASTLVLVSAPPAGAVFDTWGSTKVNSDNWASNASTLGIAQGANGYPIVVYDYQETQNSSTTLAVFACTVADCTSGTKTILDPPSGYAGPQEPRVVVGSNGLPVIIYQAVTIIGTDLSLLIYACSTTDCSAGTDHEVPAPPEYNPVHWGCCGSGSSLTFQHLYVTIGSDGLPVAAFQFHAYWVPPGGGNIRHRGLGVFKCSTADCSTHTITHVTPTTGHGYRPAIAIGADGYPVISHELAGLDPNEGVGLYKCTALDCSTGTDLGRVISARGASAIAVGADGLPLVASTNPSYTNQFVNLYKCTAADCSTGTSSTLQFDEYVTADYPDMLVGPDGLPVIVVNGGTDLLVYQCTAADCSTGTMHTAAAGIGGNAPIAYFDSANNLVMGHRGGQFFSWYNDIWVTTAGAAAGFTTVQSGGSTAVTEGGSTDAFTVVLDTQPASDVVLSAASSDPGEANVAPTTLTFTTSNWNTAQTITVTGVDDDLLDGNQTATVTLSVVDGSSADAFDPLANQTVAVTNADDDSFGLSVVQSDGSTGTTESGATDSFTVVLNTQPASDVVLAVASSDTGEVTVAPATLTFTSGNWDTGQAVTVTGVADTLVDGTQNATVTLSVVDASSDDDYDSVADVAVSVTNDDVDSMVVTTTTTVVTTTVAAGSLSLSVTSSGTDGVLEWTPDVTAGLTSFTLAWRDPSGV
ncbi:uncharacterized protein METZ01_LOCUS165907, partial [marine metagenome]